MTAKHTPLPELAAKFNGRVQCGPDMWILRDCPLGVNMITLGVPHGDKLTAPAVAHRFNAYPDLKEKLAQLEHQTTEQGRMLGDANLENARLKERVAELEGLLLELCDPNTGMMEASIQASSEILQDRHGLPVRDENGRIVRYPTEMSEWLQDWLGRARAALAKAKGGA